MEMIAESFCKLPIQNRRAVSFLLFGQCNTRQGFHKDKAALHELIDIFLCRFPDT
jgi:hypothetical protein